MLVVALAACGGGDDDADPTATTASVASTTVPATATETGSASGDGASASPTQSEVTPTSAASPTAPATAPSRPIATTAPTQAASTPTPSEGTGVAEIEAQLMSALIQPEDLIGDWTQDAFGPMVPDDDDDDELCGQPPFPGRDERIAGVEAEYSSAAGEPAFLLENIVLFPTETAIEAIEYAREVSSCGEWTDSDGQTFTVVPLDAPDYGDESYAASISFEIGGTPFMGEYTFIRIDGAIATIAFISVDGADMSQYQGLIELAAERLEEVAASTSNADGLASLLLVPADVALVDAVNDWELGEPVDDTDDERYSVCEAESFPDVFGAADEVGHEMIADPEAGPYMIHSIVQMMDGDGEEAMDWIRTELSCSSWSDEDGEYEVIETGDLDVGDDSYWLIVEIVAPDGSGLTAQVGFGFTQIGDAISVIGLASEGTLDAQLFGGLIALGAEKVFSGMP